MAGYKIKEDDPQISQMFPDSKDQQTPGMLPSLNLFIPFIEEQE
jgi:hypothetical protein